jgi:transposase
MDEPACPGCRALMAEVATLRAQVADLSRRLDEALRAGKRQAAPFRKGPPTPDPKPPGRKSGDAHGRHGHRPPPPPDQIDEVHECRLPDRCPCGGAITETGVAAQFQTDIPRQPLVRKFNVHVGRCRSCGRRIQGRHALQTSDALGAAASQVGPDAQAAAVLLNKQAGLSHGKVAAVFDALFGLRLTRGASAQIGLRSADRCRPAYESIRRAARDSPWQVPDETSWRVGGRPAWLHAFAGRDATCYVIDPTRSGRAAEQVLGDDYSGILVHDGWAVYDAFEAARRTCSAAAGSCSTRPRGPPCGSRGRSRPCCARRCGCATGTPPARSGITGWRSREAGCTTGCSTWCGRPRPTRATSGWRRSCGAIGTTCSRS